MQFVAVFHAYKFTHFSQNETVKTKSPNKLTTVEKVKTLFFGINNPRPSTGKYPETEYISFDLGNEIKLSCWLIEVENSKGTVALFHGYSGEKSQLLDRAYLFNSMGFNTVLVDFLGSGESSGSQTTLGFYEANQVKMVYDTLLNFSNTPIYLYGTSMGAVAIMRSIAKNGIQAEGVILECPFGTMHTTVQARFRNMKAPVFPMATLLTFWGGLINGFWAFEHNPIEYAKEISCSTLLLIGGKDETVSMAETEQIFSNLKGKKRLRVYPNAKHENYLLEYKKEWSRDVEEFLLENVQE